MSTAPWYRGPIKAALSLASPAGGRARLSILIFHRVLPQPDPMLPDEPDAARFDAVCRWLKAGFNVLPLDVAMALRDRGVLPPRALCITFDDGYADNHDVAMPVLLRHGLPATFFIATGFLDGGRMWNDTLIESARGSPHVQLDLRALELPGLTTLPLSTPTERLAASLRLIAACKYLEPAPRLRVVGSIAALSAAPLPDDLMMTSRQVRAMADAGMTIGAHTVSHPILARVTDDEAARQMAESRTRLEAIVGRSVDLFAYPNGRPGQDYGARDVRLARAAGFRCAVSTAPGAADRATDAFQLPRFTPWDLSEGRFLLRMLRNTQHSVATV